MAATTPTRVRWDSRRIEASAPRRHRFNPFALGISLAVHAVFAAMLIFFLARIEQGYRVRPADYIDVTILAAAPPTPAPPLLPVAPLAQEPRLEAQHHQRRHIEVEVKPPDDPAPERAPDVAVAPDGAQSTGTIPAPGGSGLGDAIQSGADDGDDSANGDTEAPIPAERVAHPPEIETYVVPEYPKMARLRSIQGRVLLRLVVDASGKVEDNVKVEDSIPMLDQAAIDAVQRWSFTPARDADGTPVRVELVVPIRFTLR